MIDKLFVTPKILPTLKYTNSQAVKHKQSLAVALGEDSQNKILREGLVSHKLTFIYLGLAFTIRNT